MAGERLVSARADATGIPGDRAWGEFNAASGQIAHPSQSKWFQAMPQAWSRIGDCGAIEVSTDNESWGDPMQARCQPGLNELPGFDAVLRRDWKDRKITSVLHEKRGGYANNMASLHGLTAKAKELGVEIFERVAVTPETLRRPARTGSTNKNPPASWVASRPTSSR